MVDVYFEIDCTHQSIRFMSRQSSITYHTQQHPMCQNITLTMRVYFPASGSEGLKS